MLLATGPVIGYVGFALLQRASRGVNDPVLLGLLDAWVEDLERNYRELVDGMPPA